MGGGGRIRHREYPRKRCAGPWRRHRAAHARADADADADRRQGADATSDMRARIDAKRARIVVGRRNTLTGES